MNTTNIFITDETIPAWESERCQSGADERDILKVCLGEDAAEIRRVAKRRAQTSNECTVNIRGTR